MKLFGMIHLPRMSFDSTVSLDDLISYSVTEAKKLEEAGFKALMVENFNDVPFPKSRVSDLVFAKFSALLYRLRRETDLEIGVNVLRNGCEQAMVLATLHNCEYIRCNVWESAYVTDQGIIETPAYEVIRLKHVLSSDVKILADVMVKHARPLGTESIIEAAKNVNSRGGAHGIIVSGVATGSAPELSQIEKLNAVGIKPIIGSGFSVDLVDTYREKISGAIVGTSIKVGGVSTNPIDIERAKAVVKAINE